MTVGKIENAFNAANDDGAACDCREHMAECCRQAREQSADGPGAVRRDWDRAGYDLRSVSMHAAQAGVSDWTLAAHRVRHAAANDTMGGPDGGGFMALPLGVELVAVGEHHDPLRNAIEQFAAALKDGNAAELADYFADILRDALRATPPLKVKRLHEDAKMPRYMTAGAACFDVHAIEVGEEGISLHSTGSAYTFRTGLAFEVPQGYVMLVFSRSGHGFNADVRLSNCVGVIDSDYRGELRVRLAADAKDYTVREGERVAQCMLLPVQQWSLVEAGELSDTARGEGAYGSTGR